MRGLSMPTGAHDRRRRCNGYAEDSRSGCPTTSRAAKTLLAEAGYPNGFEVTLDCPNNRYINDEEICQALAAMWAQIGVKAKLNAMPRAHVLPEDREARHQPLHAGLGRARPSTRCTHAAVAARAPRPAKGDGNYNFGRYSNPQDRRADRRG